MRIRLAGAAAPGSVQATSGREAVAALVAMAAAVAWSWPLAGRLTTHLRDRYDCAGIAWTLAWVQQALLRHPGSLFDANCFAPSRGTLAFSEPLFGYALAGLPLRLAGANPVAVHNLLFLAGLAFTAWAVGRLARDLGVGFVPSVLGGIGAAFGANTAAHLSHLSFTAWGIVAVSVSAWIRLHRAPGGRTGLRLGASLGAAAWLSFHLFAFSWAALALLEGAAVVSALRAGGGFRTALRRRIGAGILAGVVAAAMIAPLAVPMMAVRAREDLRRSRQETLGHSARRSDWLRPSGQHVAQQWLGPSGGSERSLYPGTVVIALSLVAVGAAVRRRRPAGGDAGPSLGSPIAVGLLLFALGYLGSLGFRGPLWPLLVAALPPVFGGIRAAARFSFVADVGLGLLAGAGLAVLAGAVRQRARRAGLVAAIGMALAIDLRIREPFDGAVEWPPSGADAHFATVDPGGPILHLPYTADIDDSRHMLDSAIHFRPVVNGVISWVPQRFRDLAARLRGSEISPEVLDRLEDWPVAALVLHDHGADGSRLAALRRFLADGVESGRLAGPLERRHGAGVDRVFAVTATAGVRPLGPGVDAATLSAAEAAFVALARTTPPAPDWVAAEGESRRGLWLIPGVAHAPGAGGARWRTDLFVMNPGVTPVRVDAAFVDEVRSVPASFVLAPGESRWWRDGLVSLFRFEEEARLVGAIRLFSDGEGPLVVAATTFDASRGESGSVQPAVRCGDGMPGGGRGFLPGLPASRDGRINIGLANVGFGEARVRVRLLGPGGETRGVPVDVTLPPGVWRQVTDLRKAAGDPEGPPVTAEVEVEGEGRVWASGSLFDGASPGGRLQPVLSLAAAR